MNSEDSTSVRHRAEIAAGDRFEFGKNWQRFLETVDEKSILRAEESLTKKLGLPALQGRSFLDVGSGSGLFSLAARRLGAKVHSFDYDSESVGCTRELRSRYFGDDSQWRVEQGSVLDRPYVEKLGRFGVVYSWGVLHHTGAMWTALENVSIAVEDGGLLFIAIYNDQGKPSRRWTRVKVAYNRLPPSLRFLVLWPGFVVLWWRRLLKDLLSLKPLRTWRHELNRGMSPWHDVVDWVGGYPFEVAKPDEIFRFFRDKGFHLVEMATQAGDLGCNEFVFVKQSAGSDKAALTQTPRTNPTGS